MMNQPKHVLVVSCLVRNSADEILLVKHHIRGWELPQGRVEEGDGLIFALSREVLEETGVTISHAKLAVIWSRITSYNVCYTKLLRFSSTLQSFASGVEILGPSPCPLSRLRGKSRHQILLKSTERASLRHCLNHLDDLSRKIPRQVQLHVDVDPLDML